MAKKYFGSETFCAMPFVNLTTTADGAFRFCCIEKGTIEDKDGKKLFLDKKSPSEVWNEHTFKEVREHVINGKKHPGCVTCYEQEELGERSFRLNMTDEWIGRLGRKKMREMVMQAMDNDYNVFDDPVYLDLKLGTLCNLKCRMCNPFNSSQIEREQEELWDKDEDYRESITYDFGKKGPGDIAQRGEWFEADIFWKDLVDYIPNLKKVYFTGGEPTMIKGNTLFLKEALDRGRQDLNIFFNTNCTNLNKRFFEYISQFDRVDINGSLDGFGKMNDYIRYPAKWSSVSKVFEQYATLSNVNLGATPVVQVYNIFNLVDNIRYIESVKHKYERDVFMDFLLNLHPTILDVRILPRDLRLQAREELGNYYETLDKNSLHGLTKSGIETVLNMLNDERDGDVEKIKMFLRYTKALDKHRGQKFEEYCPRIYERLKEYY